MTKSILYYTDSILDKKIADPVRFQLAKISHDRQMPIISVSLLPLDFGKNIALSLKRGYLTMFKQILTGLESVETEVVHFCEHDVLYHPSHFDFTPTDRKIFYYNINVWKMRAEDGHSLWVNECVQVSGLCGFTEELIKHYKERIAFVEKNGKYDHGMGFEPAAKTNCGVVWENDYSSKNYKSEFPNVDIRHNSNLTKNRWSKDQFRKKIYCEGWTESKHIPGWGDTEDLIEQFI